MASKSTPDLQELHLLKSRVKELEEEVSKYKKRLDDLRKAKNTTVLKREREVLEVNGPNLGKRRESTGPDARVAALEKQVEAMKLRHEQELNDIEERQQKERKPNFVCDHAEVIAALRTTVHNLEEHSSLLEVENSDLKERVESLVMELSIKEAQWCEAEEKMNLKLKQQWGEKYAEWMQQTEQKLEDLQRANNLMRTLLKKQGQSDGIIPPDTENREGASGN